MIYKAKHFISIVAFIFIYSAILNVETLKAQTKNVFENTSFKSGEKLNYEMSYGWVTGGKATVVLEETTFMEKPAYHVKATGYTVGLADKIFYVYDVYESYFDPETCLPFKAIRNVREDKYKRYQVDFFDHDKNTVTSLDKPKKNVKENTFDVISAAFSMRKEKFKDIKPGDIIRVSTYFHDEPWELVVRFKSIETIKLGIGKIECMKFKPIVQKGTFEDEDALSIWISNDDNRVPVLVEMKFFVGSFRTELASYVGLKNEFTFKKK